MKIDYKEDPPVKYMGSKGHIWTKSRYEQLLKDVGRRKEKRNAAGSRKKRIGWIQPKEGYEPIFLGNDLKDIVLIFVYFIFWYLFIFGIYVLFFNMIDADSITTLYCFAGLGAAFMIAVYAMITVGQKAIKAEKIAEAARLEAATA